MLEQTSIAAAGVAIEQAKTMLHKVTRTPRLLVSVEVESLGAPKMNPLWISAVPVFTALMTALIAVIVTWIAFRQYKTANAKLNLDLFDKRLTVYQKVRDAVSIVNTHGRSNDIAERNLLEAMAGSEFLFGEDIRRYLDEMWERFLQLRATQEGLKSEDAETRKRSSRAKSDLVMKITQFYYEGADVFAHYMRMDHRLRKPLRKKRERPRQRG